MKRNRVSDSVLLVIFAVAGAGIGGAMAGPSDRSIAVDALMAQDDTGVEECRRSCERRFDCSQFDSTLDVPTPETPDFGQPPAGDGPDGSGQMDSPREGLDSEPPDTPLLRSSEAEECRDRLHQCLRECG